MPPFGGSVVSSVACADAGAANTDDQRDDERAERERGAGSREDAVTRAAPVAAPAGSAARPPRGPAKSSDVVRLAERAGVAGGDVEQRRPDEARDQRGDDRQQAGDARRLPRREEEPDRRARRRTSRGGGRCARAARRRCRGASAGTATAICTSAMATRIQRNARFVSGSHRHRHWCGFGTDGGEDAGREVGDRRRGREPHAAVERLGAVREGAAVGARRRGARRRVGSSTPGSSPSSRAEIA